MRSIVVSVLAVSCLAAIASATSAAPVRADDDELVPSGKGWGQRAEPGPAPGQVAGQGRREAKGQGSRTLSSNGINYHGGPVMLPSKSGAPPHVYYIWYGTWTSPATDILTSLAQNIAPSNYFDINTTYYNAANQRVANAIGYAGSTSDNYSKGTSLSDSGVQAVVASAISSGRLPLDSNGVYFVLTSPDVNETSGFCTQYCGWHTHATISGTDIKFAFVGNPNRCPSACEMQDVGPNGTAGSGGLDSGADGMASIISHELEESVTDPDLNAWYDKRGQENADKCAWTFGTTYTAPNGATYNMTLGSGSAARQFLIQRNWVNASGGFCAQSY